MDIYKKRKGTGLLRTSPFFYRPTRTGEIKRHIYSLAFGTTHRRRPSSRFIRSPSLTNEQHPQRSNSEAAWRWMRSQWSWIEQTFASDKSHDYFPRYAAMLLMTRQQLAEYREFFTPLRRDQSLARAIDMGILDLEGKLDLIDRDKATVIAALAK